MIIEEIFKSINKHASNPLPRGNFMIRSVSHDLNTNLAWHLPMESDSMGNYKDSLYNFKNVNIDKYPSISCKVVVPIDAPMD